MAKTDKYCNDCELKETCTSEKYPMKITKFGSTITSNFCNYKKRIPKNSTVKKQKTIGELKEELWLVFRDYIVYRDNLKCITCTRQEKVLNRTIMQCGHFISKQQYSIFKFEPLNNNCQCSDCNGKTFDRGVAWYSHKVMEKHGMKIHKWLTENAFWNRPFESVYGFIPKRQYWEAEIQKYKKLAKEEKERFERENFL